VTTTTPSHRPHPVVVVATIGATQARRQIVGIEGLVFMFVLPFFAALTMSLTYDALAGTAPVGFVAEESVPTPASWRRYDDQASARTDLMHGSLSAVVVADSTEPRIIRGDATPSDVLIAINDVLAGRAPVTPDAENRSRQFAGAAALGLFLLMGATAASGELVEGRLSGAYKRMRAVGAKTWQVASGEVLARLLLAAVQAAVLLAALRLAGFTWPIGAPALVGVVALYCLSCSAIAVITGAIPRTMEQSALVSITAALAVAFVGGAVVPSAALPGVLQRLAPSLPSYWFVEGLTHTGSGTTVGALLVAAAFACALWLVAGLTWRHFSTVVD
jgi:hypothetical protein